MSRHVSPEKSDNCRWALKQDLKHQSSTEANLWEGRGGGGTGLANLAGIAAFGDRAGVWQFKGSGFRALGRFYRGCGGFGLRLPIDLSVVRGPTATPATPSLGTEPAVLEKWTLQSSCEALSTHPKREADASDAAGSWGGACNSMRLGTYVRV